MIARLAALALGLCLAAGGVARAQDAVVLEGTLKDVAARGTLRVGYRRNSVPFAFLNKGGQPVGFSVELCRGIAVDVARLLNRDLVEPDAPAWQTGVRLVFVAVGADERIPKVTSGEIDLECGSTTATAERAKSVAFSPVFCLAGTKLLVPAEAADAGRIASYRDLAGKAVAVSTGTTNAEAVRRLAGSVGPPIAVAEAPSVDAAFELLQTGKAAALASDDILLYGLAASRPEARLRVVGDYLSFEPYAIMYRRNDPAFAALVRSSFERMAREGVLSRGYGRWFLDKLPNGETLNLPMGAQLAEMYRALGQPD